MTTYTSYASLVAKVTALNEIADDLAGEFEPAAALERILARCIELMRCHAGSISSVDEVAGIYRKEADIGIRCQSGQVFSLDEGMTGEVVRRRGPAWFDQYEDVAGGHLHDADRGSLWATIGVPLEWRGKIIGACVVFSRDPRRRFGQEDAQLLGMFARHAAVALANATMHAAVEERARLEAAVTERTKILAQLDDLLTQGVQSVFGEVDGLEQRLGQDAVLRDVTALRDSMAGAFARVRGALRSFSEGPHDDRALDEIMRSELLELERAKPLRTDLVVTGRPVALDRAMSRDTVRILRELIANVVQHASARTVRVGLTFEFSAVRLVVQDDGRGFAVASDEAALGPGHQRVIAKARELGGEMVVDSELGWGTSVRVRLPYRRVPGGGSPRLPVLVVGSRPVTSAGIGRLITWADPSIAVIGEATRDENMLDAVHRLRPAVVIIAHDTPEQLLGAVHRLVAAAPDIAVLAVCPDLGPDMVSEALLAGATGCLTDGADGTALAEAVVATSKGQSVVPALGPAFDGLTPEVLTTREREVRLLVEQGLPNKAIADQLVISVKTVEKHVGAVLRKAGLTSRTELLIRRTARR